VVKSKLYEANLRDLLLKAQEKEKLSLKPIKNVEDIGKLIDKKMK